MFLDDEFADIRQSYGKAQGTRYKAQERSKNKEPIAKQAPKAEGYLGKKIVFSSFDLDE